MGLGICLLVLLPACRDIGGRLDETGGRNGAPPPPAETIDDLGAVGSAARPMLRKGSFTQVVIEIANVAGRDPNDNAVSHLKAVLAEVSGKPVSVQEHQIAAGDGSYTAEEIRDRSRMRNNNSSEPTAAIWIGYLDGVFAENEEAIGAAVGATVAAIFPDQIGSISSLLQPGAIERAVLVHEIGHLLALVNIGYRSKIDHEDPEHPNHSNNRGSVMYWAVETLSVADLFRGGPPDNFDSADREDLSMLGRS